MTDIPPASADDPEARELASLRASFPQFRIWPEITCGRLRYIARGLHPGTHPHTLVTPDPAELRAALSAAPNGQAIGQPFHAAAPSVARVYDRWLGGTDNLAADRAAADGLAAEFPEVVVVARANRQFVARAVRCVAAQGIAQFIDLGAGLPISPAVHEIAQRADPAARVAYVDNDPAVLTRAHAVLGAGPGVAVLPGDVREPGAVLGSPDLRALIDLDQPVCVILASVLHFLLASEADLVTEAFRTVMTPGSYLIVSAGTCSGASPVLVDRLAAAYAGTTVVTARPEAEIRAYFDGLDLLPPGLADVWAWRPESEWHWPPPPSARIIGGVARKPGSKPPREVGAHGNSRSAHHRGPVIPGQHYQT
jgi:S-adenosyl methyltransferase